MSNLPMTTERTAQTGIDLLRIVRINEEIKRVVAVSFKINIMALNAIFLAKRAGTAARGFAVLSNEFRSFSEQLRSSMAALTGMVYGCVNEVSLMLQDIRFTRLLQEAERLSPQGSLATILERRERTDLAHGENLARLRGQLRRALDDAFQMVELGGVLAKSAKIEAAYGQAFAVPLSQVSGEFDHIVEEIRASLESLRRSAFFSSH
jgi:methyl-accepting chemotaxis protein